MPFLFGNNCLLLYSVAWLVRQMRSLLTHSLRMEPRQVHAICVDLVFAFFICPAIVNPDPCGIVEAPISPIARSNLIQVAQILQLLAHSKWEPLDPKMNDLYSRFDKHCVSSILDAILEEGSSGASFSSASSVESSPSAEPSIDTHRLLQGLNRSVVLVTESELQTFVTFLRNALSDGALDPIDKATLEALVNPLPVYPSPSKSSNGDQTPSNGDQSPPSVKRNLLGKLVIKINMFDVCICFHVTIFLCCLFQVK